MLGLERQAEDVVLGEQSAKVMGIFRSFVDLGRSRSDPPMCHLANGVAEIQVLLGHPVELGEC